MSASPSTAATLIAGAAKAQRGAFDLADLIGGALRHFADVAAADARTRRAHAGEQAALTISAGLTADVDRLRAEVKVMYAEVQCLDAEVEHQRRVIQGLVEGDG
jgi:hypothetical protein